MMKRTEAEIKRAIGWYIVRRMVQAAGVGFAAGFALGVVVALIVVSC